MTTIETVNDHAQQSPDLIVLVTTGDHLPGAHLTQREGEQVSQDWFNYGALSAGIFEQYWNVAIAHLRVGQIVVTGHMQIPRSVAAAEVA